MLEVIDDDEFYKVEHQSHAGAARSQYCQGCCRKAGSSFPQVDEFAEIPAVCVSYEGPEQLPSAQGKNSLAVSLQYDC
jgi:hypothetical protein